MNPFAKILKVLKDFRVRFGHRAGFRLWLERLKEKWLAPGLPSQ
jgi:hypothetical protein